MSLFSWILIGLALAGFTALGVVILRFNLKHRHIARCARAATPDQLDRVYASIEQIGTESPAGYMLVRALRPAPDADCVVPLPNGLEEFPWGGKAVRITCGKDAEFRVVDEPGTEARLGGQTYRLVRVPRVQQKKSGKVRNVFAPERYIAQSPQLLATLREICPESPAELLSYLLMGNDSFEFDSIDQGRVATSPSWLQGAEWQSCDVCKKRMALILQIPGIMITKQLSEGTCYFFGCVSHPEQTRWLTQFS
jgi:hypothetical protein